jgi:UTP--glucose-1-phosphate uridylyltransferase
MPDPELLAADKMRAAGQTDDAITAFASALRRLRSGAATLLPSSELEPVPDVPRLAELPQAAEPEALASVAIIRLNGGLATSMGLREPKSLLTAHGGRTFLEIIVGQTLAWRARSGARLPLVLMHSEATREPTLAALAGRPELAVDGIPLDFMQSMVPKLDAETLAPVRWPPAPALEWCPPGHGDVYGALRGSGMLAALRAAGFRYAMIANADNLGATIDPRIPAHMDAQGIPFLMEVVQGTEADRKGGHLARRRADGRIVLRETAQTPPEDEASFRDFRRWRYYNTNTLWIELDALDRELSARGSLELPVIVNRKTVDPRDADSPAVLQLESAMGAAIGSFPGAALLEVPRTRFLPVKTTDNLLLLRSDVYELRDGDVLVPVAEPPPYVELDRAHYRLIDAFEARFPAGPPSLRGAERFVVRGDITFEAGVTVAGAVELDAPEPRRIPAGTRLP